VLTMRAIEARSGPRCSGLPQVLRALLTGGRLDVLTFASPSAVQRFRALLDPDALAAAARCVVAAIGPVTAEALRDAGLPASAIAVRPGVEGLVDAIAACVAEAREAR